MESIKSLNEYELSLSVGVDGASLPILDLSIQIGKQHRILLLDKENTEKLIKQLQILVSEM